MSIEKSFGRLLLMRMKKPEIGFTRRHKMILMKICNGKKIVNWERLAEMLNFSQVEKDILRDSMKTDNWSVRRQGKEDDIMDGLTEMKAKFISWRKGWSKGFYPKQDTMTVEGMPGEVLEPEPPIPEWCKHYVGV